MAAQFSWAAAGDVGLGIANAISSWGTASANKIVASAQRQANAVIQDAQNKERAAGLSLAATMRGIGYRAALTNAGTEFNNTGELIARTHEAFTRQGFEQNLRDVEQLGSVAARSAAAGVGGASVRAVSYSMKLQQDRLAERQQERNGEVNYELVKQQSGIMPATTSRLDISPLTPNIDYTPQIAQGGNGGNMLLQLAQGILSKRQSLQVLLDSIQTDKPVNLGTATGQDMSVAFDMGPASSTVPDQITIQ